MIEAAPISVPTNAYVTTPALPGVFGVGPLGNPTAASLVSFATNAVGFTAELLVQNGANGSTRVYVSSVGTAVVLNNTATINAPLAGTDALFQIVNSPMANFSQRFHRITVSQ